MAIENGAGRDMLSSGMVTLADDTIGHEMLALTASGYEAVISMIERNILEDAGVLPPLD